MALRIYLAQNELNDKVGVVGNYYARVDNLPPIGIDELADLIKEYNIGFSKGSIVGILKDMVSIIRRQVLSGQPVKIDDLAIFKASVENKGGWADLKDVSLHIGGEKDNIQAIRLLAQATGDFTKAELSKDGKLVLDRQSAALVQAAGGDPDGEGTTENGGGSASGGSSAGGNGGGSAAQTLAAPTISGSGTFAETTEVTITGPDGATIHYTTDGATPTAESTLYSEAFTLSATTTVKAIAIKDGQTSEVASRVFTKSSGGGGMDQN